MNDPYGVLNVSPNDSDEDIKKAYRELARKYHPDNYRDNPLSDLATEKMKEINEAYDEIMRMRSGNSSSGGGRRQGGGRSSPYGAGFRSGGQGVYAEIRAAVAMGNIARAEQLLAAISNRDAEWHFLMGSVAYRKGWFDEAERYFETACSMNPGNAEYAQALNQIRSGAAGNPYYRSRGGYGTQMDSCDCCTSLLCANCLCNCCCR